MDCITLKVLSILLLVVMFIIGFMLKDQIAEISKKKLTLSICSIIFLLVLEFNVLTWSANLSSCFLDFSNQFIVATSEQEKLNLINKFFPESYNAADREKVLNDFNNYLFSKPISAAEVVQVGRSPVGPLIVRVDANGHFITEPYTDVSFSTTMNFFSEYKYKIADYTFRTESQ